MLQLLCFCVNHVGENSTLIYYIYLIYYSMYAYIPKSAINHKSYIGPRMFMSTEEKIN